MNVGHADFPKQFVWGVNISKIASLVKKQNKRFKNVNLTAIGLPGSGKSYGGLRLIEEITGRHDESLMEFVHFDGNEFINCLKRPSENEEWETHFLDDAGFTMAGREWWKEKNIDFVKEIQVVRMELKNMFFSTPHPRLVDSGLGPITHLMLSLDYWQSVNTGKGNVRRHVVEMTERGVKDYWKYDHAIEFSHLDDTIAKAYERKKRKDLKKKKEKQTVTTRDMALFKLLKSLHLTTYDDIAERIINRNGQIKPYGYRELGELLGKKKDWVAGFMKRMSSV